MRHEEKQGDGEYGDRDASAKIQGPLLGVRDADRQKKAALRVCELPVVVF